MIKRQLNGFGFYKASRKNIKEEKKMDNKFIKIGFVSLIFLLAGSVMANVETNYYDDFSGGVTTLNNTTPDITIDSATWDTVAGITADGGFTVGAAGNRNAFLPSAIEAGRTYRISVDVNLTVAGDTQRAGLFLVGNDDLNGTSIPTTSNSGQDGIFLRGDGNVQIFQNGNFLAVDGGNSASETLSILLSTHADATPWSAAFYVADTLVASHEYTSSPAFGRIAIGATAFGTTTLEGSFDNFIVTVIPEPATGVLLGISAGFAFLIRRFLLM
jgi:hypothetical protein